MAADSDIAELDRRIAIKVLPDGGDQPVLAQAKFALARACARARAG